MTRPTVDRGTARNRHPVSALRILRVSAGYSQRELASACGLQRPTVTDIENGLQTPRPQTAAKIAAALQQPVGIVFPDKGTGQ